MKHGFYSQRLRALAGDFAAAAEEPLDLSGEIALLRVVFARAVGSAPPQVVALIAGTLCRLMKAQTDLAEIAAEAGQIKRHPGGLAERMKACGWGQGRRPEPPLDQAPQP